MFLTIYNVYERIQLIVFTLQELLISVLYIRAAFKMLLPDDSTTEPLRMTKRSLIYLNVLCIVLDIAFVGEVYSGEWVYKTGTQSLAYAIKLTIELIVLNKLMDVYRLRPGACAACRYRHHSSKVARSGDLHPSEYGYWSRPRPSMMAHGSGGRASWQRRRAKGVVPLGPFEEIDVEHEMVGAFHGLQSPAEGGEQPPIQDAAKGITVTTGISTWSERRNELASPVEERQVQIDRH